MTLANVVGGLVFIAAGIITLFSAFNWQAALILFAIGIGLLLFAFKS
jgi:hypothetical protein